MATPEFVIHRVNERDRLRGIPREFGVEIDLRADGGMLVLNHDPFCGGERFADWLEAYEHGLLVLNIKEAGIEAEVIRLVEARGITRFFLLDVEFPYIHRAARAGERRIAIRYSEEEAIGTALHYRGKVDWVWIDTTTLLPLNAKIAGALEPFRSCLVCPSRWGRSQDIPAYRERLNRLNYMPAAIMTDLTHVKTWQP